MNGKDRIPAVSYRISPRTIKTAIVNYNKLDGVSYSTQIVYKLYFRTPSENHMT